MIKGNQNRKLIEFIYSATILSFELCRLKKLKNTGKQTKNEWCNQFPFHK